MSILGVAEKIKKRRGKYNMTENKNKLEARGVSLTNAQWERCDKLAEQLGKKSRNTFIREAVDFYCAWLEKEHIENSFCRRSNPFSRQRYATANRVFGA